MMRTVAGRVLSRAAARSFAASNTRGFAANEYRDLSKQYFDREDSQYTLGKHRSNALELIEKQAVIEVDGEMAICDGGGGNLGHPIEYISLEQPGSIKECIYCGLKYTQKAH